MKSYKNAVKVHLQAVIGLFGLFSATQTMPMAPVQGPIMSQQRLLAQKDALQYLVKNVLDNCVRAVDAKLPGVLNEHENIIYINRAYPDTEDNIFLIQKTVKDVINAASMSSLQFDQQGQEQALKLMLERMITKVFMESVFWKEGSVDLFWCLCTSEYKRITLALLMVNEIREKFPNKNQRIVYTSVASGSLLQDYIILSELLLSHTNVLVNLIDLEYPEIPALAKKDLQLKEPRSLHVMEKKNKQRHAYIIDSFKVKIAQVISTIQSGQMRYNVDVNIYQNAYEYIARVQRNPDEKSNVLLMTDPAVGTAGMADFPSLANVVNLWIDQEKEPVFTFYLPRHQGAQLYQLKEFSNSEVMAYLQNQLQKLVLETGINKNYTPQFVRALLDKTMSFGKQITDEALALYFPQLMQIRAGLKQEALRNGYVADDLLEPLTPIKLGDAKVLLSWGTDAHICFQDLVWDAITSNAVIYQLYAVDPTVEGDYPNQIIKINPDVYKNMDVITPNSGAFTEEYKRIL